MKAQANPRKALGFTGWHDDVVVVRRCPLAQRGKMPLAFGKAFGPPRLIARDLAGPDFWGVLSRRGVADRLRVLRTAAPP